MHGIALSDAASKTENTAYPYPTRHLPPRTLGTSTSERGRDNILPFRGFHLSKTLDKAWLIAPYEPRGSIIAYVNNRQPNDIDRFRFVSMFYPGSYFILVVTTEPDHSRFFGRCSKRSMVWLIYMGGRTQSATEI